MFCYFAEQLQIHIQRPGIKSFWGRPLLQFTHPSASRGWVTRSSDNTMCVHTPILEFAWNNHFGENHASHNNKMLHRSVKLNTRCTEGGSAGSANVSGFHGPSWNWGFQQTSVWKCVWTQQNKECLMLDPNTFIQRDTFSLSPPCTENTSQSHPYTDKTLCPVQMPYNYFLPVLATLFSSTVKACNLVLVQGNQLVNGCTRVARIPLTHWEAHWATVNQPSKGDLVENTAILTLQVALKTWKRYTLTSVPRVKSKQKFEHDDLNLKPEG